MAHRLELELAELLDDLGYELVAMERGGGRKRPLLRLRVDRPGAEPGSSPVTVDDCARVSRAVEEFLEGREPGGGSYILEVSSPGVERPLVRPADYERFAGRRVRLRGYAPLWKQSRQVEGALLGLASHTGREERVALDVEGERVEIPLAAVARATLVYRPEDDL